MSTTLNRSWVFTLLTNDPELATAADQAGIDRIGLDLEVLKKQERQRGSETWISSHKLTDCERIYPCIARGARFARTNPFHDGTVDEVEALLSAGADVLMLPYFHTLDEVESFSAAVRDRAVTVALVETRASLEFVEQIIVDELVTEIHFGLTDLGLQMGKGHPELLDDVDVLRAIARVRATGTPFGIAGLARPGTPSLPYDPGAFAQRISKLGASRALISRSFFAGGYERIHLAKDIAALRTFLGPPLPVSENST